LLYADGAQQLTIGRATATPTSTDVKGSPSTIPTVYLTRVVDRSAAARSPTALAALLLLFLSIFTALFAFS